MLKSSKALAAVLALGCVLSSPGQAQEKKNAQTSVGGTFVMSLGGKLFDDVFVMTETKAPSKPNPDYPNYIKPDGLGTWRCVACHGWDYRGQAGERGRHAKSLAFKSLAHLEGVEPADILKRFKVVHPSYFGKILVNQAPEFLSMFLSGGQYVRGKLLDANNKGTGSAGAGQAIFEGACANCHQLDGMAFLRGEPGDKSSLGWVSRNRPEQVLHKIMNGFPGTDMLAMRFLDRAHIADLLTYMQTLDEKQK